MATRAHGGKEVGAIDDGQGEPADSAIGIRHHVEITAPRRGLDKLRQVELHPGGAHEGHFRGLGIQTAHQVIAGGLDEGGAHQPLRLHSSGGASHPSEEEAQDRGRTFFDDLRQFAVHIDPPFFLSQQAQDFRRRHSFPDKFLAQVGNRLKSLSLLFLGKDDVQSDDPGAGLFHSLKQSGDVFPGPGPASYFFHAVVVDGQDDHLFRGGPGSPEPEFQVIELKLDELDKGGTPEQQNPHQHDGPDYPTSDGRF